MDNKIKIIVFNEHTMGYIHPCTPDKVDVLRALERKGAPYTTSIIYNVLISSNDNVRLADINDFEEYKINLDQYKGKEYIFKNKRD